MKKSVPAILLELAPLKRFLEQEHWKRRRYAGGKYAARKIKTTEDMLRKLDNIEQWIRSNLPEDQWKGVLE